MRTATTIAILALAPVLVGGCAPEAEDRTRAVVSECSVEVLPDNPSCESLGLTPYAYKVEPPISGTYPLDGDLGGSSVVTIETPAGVQFDWTSTLPIDAVIVKGGPNANVYRLEPEATEGFGLSAPINSSTGEPYGLSHIELCFDYEVLVTKTAEPAFTRTFGWTIDKSSTTTDVTLSTGQILSVPYRVDVQVASAVDSDARAGGLITIHNPAPVDATVTAVNDVIGDVVVPVDCGAALPIVVGPGGTLECTWASALPDKATRTNAVEVSTTGDVGPGSASATIDFAYALMDAIDACVDVTDDRYGPLGTVCAEQSPVTFEYLLDVGPYEICGDTTFVNVAAFVAYDTGAAGQDSVVLPVSVPCAEGCTLTPGYWKTHSEYGPAPYDETWSLLFDGADTPFYLTGQSYYEVLYTPPRGNVYYILAHAFIAASLNRLDGASFAAAADAFAEAEAVFAAYTPGEIAALPRRSALRGRILALARTLDDYNNGLVGPGHCSE